jgi:nitroreductase
MKNLLKKMISPEKRDQIRIKLDRYKNKTLILIISTVLRLKFLVPFYYVIAREFHNEQKVVLEGKLKHIKDKENKKGNLYLLRRNIHRLEKGLLMKPRRNVFGVRFISSTVNAFRDLIEVNYKDIEELSWFYDVLNEYFNTVDENKEVSRAKDIFIECKERLKETVSYDKKVPYLRRDKDKPNISIEDLGKLARYRRSVRWFQDQPVEPEKINNALEIAKLSPSACNRQPYEFFIINENQEILKTMQQIPMGTGGFGFNIPVMVAVVGDLSAYPFERDRHLIYIDGSLAAMSFMYGLEVQGISSCPLNWPDVPEKDRQISKLLNLRSDQRVVMLLGIGYADKEGKVAYSEKRNLEQIRKTI